MKPGNIVQISMEGRTIADTSVDGVTYLRWGKYLNKVGFITKRAEGEDKEEGDYFVSFSLDPNDGFEFYGDELIKKEHIAPFEYGPHFDNQDHAEVIVANYDSNNEWAQHYEPTRWLESDGMVRTYDTDGSLKHVEPLVTTTQT